MRLISPLRVSTVVSLLKSAHYPRKLQAVKCVCMCMCVYVHARVCVGLQLSPLPRIGWRPGT